MNLADKFIPIQNAWQRLTRGKTDKNFSLSDLSGLDGKGIQFVMHCPYDNKKGVHAVLLRGLELGADEFELNVASNIYDCPFISYCKMKMGKNLMSLATCFAMIRKEIGDTNVLLQFKSMPTEDLIDNIKEVCQSYPGIKIWVGSLNWQILKAVFEMWPEVETFRLNGTPFMTRKVREFLVGMLGAGKHVSVSFTFWQNCAKIPVLGYPIRCLVKDAILNAMADGMDVQIAATVSEKSIKKALRQYWDWWPYEVDNRLVVYLHS